MEKGKAEKKIQEYISKNGISQTFVAELLGLSPANLSATFKGRRRLKADELIIFCEHYKLDISFFNEKPFEVIA